MSAPLPSSAGAPPPPPEKRVKLEEVKVEDLQRQIQHLQETNMHFRNQISAGERQHGELQQNFIQKIQQMSTANENLQKSQDRLKAENQVLRQTAERAQKDLGRVQTELAQKSKLLEDYKVEIIKLQSSPACIAAMEEQYLMLLQEWVSTHQNTVKVHALAVFHGTKPKAKQLWHLLHDIHKVTVYDLLTRGGMKRNLLYVKAQAKGEDDTIVGITLPPGKSDLTLVESVLRTGKEDLNRRIALWLEEQNGAAKWDQFVQFFGNASSLLTPNDLVHNPDFVCIPNDVKEEEEEEGGMLLVSARRADFVLCQMFTRYLKRGNVQFVRSLEFTSFLEQVPGALQLRERISGECSANTLASKFPDLLYYWKSLPPLDDGDVGEGMCCLRQDKEKAEVEQFEQQRKRVEYTNQVEKEKLDAERKLVEEKLNFEREERKRNEWRQQQHSNGYAHHPPPATVAAANAYAPPPPYNSAASYDRPSYQSYAPPPPHQAYPAPPPASAAQAYPPTAGSVPYAPYPPPPGSYAPAPAATAAAPYAPAYQAQPGYFPPPPASWQPPPATSQQQQPPRRT